jgi:hypothetical protein
MVCLSIIVIAFLAVLVLQLPSNSSKLQTCNDSNWLIQILDCLDFRCATEQTSASQTPCQIAETWRQIGIGSFGQFAGNRRRETQSMEIDV